MASQWVLRLYHPRFNDVLTRAKLEEVHHNPRMVQSHTHKVPLACTIIGLISLDLGEQAAVPVLQCLTIIVLIDCLTVCKRALNCLDCTIFWPLTLHTI